VSWEQLLDIGREAAAEAAAQRAEPRQACPTDGEPLKTGSSNSGAQKFCPFCGWKETGVGSG
jgi:hypothetical protein